MNAGDLLAGPRGRWMLLEFARISERMLQPDYTTYRLHPVYAAAAYQFDPDSGMSIGRYGVVYDSAPEPTSAHLFDSTPDPTSADVYDPEPAPTPAEVASVLAGTELVDATLDLLMEVLIQAVEVAKYWQEPDGEEVLTAVPAVQNELERVAEHLLASEHMQWFASGFDPADQWQAELSMSDMPWTEKQAAAKVLKNDRAQAIALEARASAERPADIKANWSGEWWSIPPTLLPSSSRMLNGIPAGLLFVEDSLGFDSAVVRHLAVPGYFRVYEIDSAESWAELCRSYPRVVTYEKRHDWYRTTGRDGAWVMPDWHAVAADYDGVHLTVAAYLSAAGTVIAVSESTASVIAGWNPDQTWWLRDMESESEDEYWDSEDGINWARSEED